jgi:hypothetical protein
MSPRNLAACIAALCLTAHGAQAAFMPPALPSASASELASAQCSYGTHRDPSGYCVDSMDYSRSCPPTYFALPFPSGNGYRCVPAEWMASSGWLGNLLDPWDRGGLPR